ncbi:MAG: MFS transporter [bacterium]|nr:MFS transporter [bacterium]
MTKTIRLWYLYDFANSFASIVLIFYYPLMLAERGASNIWIGVSASISTGILLIVLPYLGAYSDRTGRRFIFIKIAAILMVVSLFVLAFLMQNIDVFSVPVLIIVSFFYVLFQVSFQGSFVFYSAMLRGITTTENNAKVSGVGLGLGQLGNAVALGIIGPIIGSSLVIIGLSGKPIALFLGGVMFAIISIPFLKQKDLKNDIEKVGFSYKAFLKEVFLEKRIFYFLIGYSLLADAILTFQLYLTLYVTKVFDFSDTLTTYAGIVALLFAVMGGFTASKFAYKLRDKEKALRASSLFYAVAFLILALVPNTPILVFFALALGGIAFGLLFSLARCVYSEISPQNKQGEFFSLYTVFERAASIVGPLVWLLTFYLLKDFGENIQYRGSMLFLVVVCLAGYYFLIKSNRAVKV